MSKIYDVKQLVELLNRMKPANRICRLCGSAFDSKLKPVDPIDSFSADFTDTEHHWWSLPKKKELEWEKRPL
jgi:hypothetical protein